MAGSPNKSKPFAETRNESKPIQLAKLKASDMAEWPSFIDVDCEGLVYRVGYKRTDRVYVAKNKLGDRYESSRLASLKEEIKGDATPMEVKPVLVGGKTVGHIMNQQNEFFYRPVGTKVIGEKLYSPQDVRESLIKQGMKLD